MSNYEVDILVRGRPIRQFKHKSNVFVEGRKGSEFELKFTNNTWQRVEAVPSVDGLSVMDGKECGVESNGYLVPARQSIVIPGWRLDNDNIAKFLFKGKDKSYSAKSGHGTKNVGAVGFMVFQEYVNYNYIVNIPTIGWPQSETHYHHHHYNNPWGTLIGGPTYKSGSDWLTSNSANACSTDTMPSSPLRGAQASVNMVSTENDSDDSKWNLGVGFGEQDSHKVREVAFTRANVSVPNEIMTIYYDSLKGLTNRGIQVIKKSKKKVDSLPNPFPTYSSGCKPPPNWKR